MWRENQKEDTVSTEDKRNVSRRSFLGAASSMLGVAALGAAGGLGLTGCAPAPKGLSETGEGGALMKSGTYTAGSKQGYWGILELPVTVTVNETSILDIKLPEDRFEHGETEVILNSVRERLIPRIISTQSLDVDSVSGATMSSFAVKEATEKALCEAIAAAGNDEKDVARFHVAVDKTEEGVTEEIDTDILFIGMGYAGIFAMRRAIERMREVNQGRPVNVLGIDSAGKIGGKSCLTHSINVINPMRYAELINDGKPFVDADMYRDLWSQYTTMESGEQGAKDEIVDLFFRESGNALDWLYFDCDYRMGTPRSSKAFDGVVDFNTIYTDRLDAGTMEDRRGAVDKLIRAISKRNEAQGARILLETQAYDLTFDGDVCTGALARDRVTGKEYKINAKAVVMNTGGFGLNDELMNSLLAEPYAGTYKMLTTGQDTGLVFKAAIDHGAGTFNCEMPPCVMNVSLPFKMERYPIEPKPGTLNKSTGRESTTTLNDVPCALGVSSDTLYVNGSGERFGNEAWVKSFASDPLSSGWTAYASGPYYYAIWSTPQLEEIKTEGFTRVKSWQKYNTQGDLHEGPLPELDEIIGYAIEDGLMWKGETLEELATAIEVDPGNLTAAVDSYNELVASGTDSQFDKDPKFLMPIDEGPYYAVKMLTVPYGSGGGLDIDDQLRVMKADHTTPFQGLYALGNDSYGVLMNPEKNYNSYGGVAQGWVLCSGYVGGRNVADYVIAGPGMTELTEAKSDIPTAEWSI